MDRMDPIPPEVELFFAAQRKKQQSFALIAATQRNLKETADTLNTLLDKANQRGATLEKREEQADELLDSSEAFHLATMPGWKRYVYSIRAPWWWPSFFACCACSKRRKKGET
jgi:hypothetical protein